MNQNTPMMNEDYHRSPRIGRSGLQLVAKSPRHYWAEYLDPNRVWKEPTKAMRIGTALHTAVLEPHLFAQEIAIEPDSWPTKAKTGRTQEEHKADFYSASAGKTIITDIERRLVMSMYDAVKRHPVAAPLLEGRGIAEEAVLFDHELTGSPSKIKPDWQNLDLDVVVDLKTAEDASPDEFARSCVNHWYDVQAAWYLDGLAQAKNWRPRQFIFVAVEKEPPYAVAVYYATEEMIKLGRRKYEQTLMIYEECRQANVWPSYPEIIQPITLPKWAFNA